MATPPREEAPPAPEPPSVSANQASIDAIVPNARQPRSVFADDRLAELAASIKQHGILQPLLVRPLPGGRYELIAGERRLRAAKLAGLNSVPITIRAAGDESSLELALIENIQREDIGPMECARAYRKLIDEFGLTQEKVADKVGKARTSVANTLRLLRLPAIVQAGLEKGTLQEGHARALLALDGPEKQIAMYEQIVATGLSVREVEQAARQKPAKPSRPAKQAAPENAALEESLSVKFGTRVKIAQSDLGGRIAIEFYSDDDLDRILQMLGISL